MDAHRPLRIRRAAAAAALATLSLGVLTACGNDSDGSPEGTAVDGGTASSPAVDLGDVVEYDDLSRNHVNGAVDYPQNPPVGGDHAPVWMTCAAYDEPVDPGMAVHSMEHGAVWLAYDPDLPSEDVDALRALTSSNGFVLVSPVEDMDSPVAATAWGRQLTQDSVDLSRLSAFVNTFAQGPQTPELGAPCTGGMG